MERAKPTGQEKPQPEMPVQEGMEGAAAAIDIEIDPQGRLFSRHQTDCALQAIVECCAAIAKVLLRWHSGSARGAGAPGEKCFALPYIVTRDA